MHESGTSTWFRAWPSGTLAHQCAAPDAGTTVEVVALSDDGSEMIGVKRNRLMDMAKGKFLVLVDDDDRISPDYVRPPCHITPIRSDIARRYRFAAVDWAEDMDWAARISQDQALQQEMPIDAVLYCFDSRRRYAWQWLLDKTQAIRHALGLRSVSRLSMQRRLKTLARHPKP